MKAPSPSPHPPHQKWEALNIALVYAFVMGLWIAVIEGMVDLPLMVGQVSLPWKLLKEFFFVTATAGVLYWLVRRHTLRVVEHANAQREKDLRLRMMASGVKDYAMFLLDPAGNIVSWNTAAESFHGYRQEEVVGKHFSIFHPQEDLEEAELEQSLSTAVAEGWYEEEGWRMRKDGTRFWANITYTALRDQDGQLRGFAKVTRDITRQKQAQEQLEQMCRQLDLVFTAAPGGIVALDSRGKITFANPAAAVLLGWDTAELPGKLWHAVVQHTNAAGGDYPGSERPLYAAFLRGLNVRLGRELLWRKDGSSFLAECASAPLRENGSATGAVVIFNELLEQKQGAGEPAAVSSPPAVYPIALPARKAE